MNILNRKAKSFALSAGADIEAFTTVLSIKASYK